MVVKRSPVKALSKKKTKKRKSPVKLTDHMKNNILVEYHEKKIDVKDIAVMYGVHEDTIYRFLRATPYTKKEKDQFYPSDVFDRVDLDPLERMKMMDQDANVDIELTLACIRYKLEKEIESTKDNIGDKTSTLTLKDLTLFFEKAAPYVLPKKDSPAKKVETKNQVKGKAHEMFKTQMEVKKAN